MMHAGEQADAYDGIHDTHGQVLLLLESCLA